MVRITISDELKAELLASDGTAELCDADGQIVARVLLKQKPIPPDWVAATPEHTPDELKQLSEYDGPAITTEELLARLRAKR